MSFISALLSFFRTPGLQTQTVPKVTTSSLEGQPLRYLIGTDNPKATDGIVLCSYDSSKGTIAYCNLFDEHNTGKYGPYLHTSDTAAEYGEGQIDPDGLGWHLNLSEQFKRRKAQGFKFVELDNPDAYEWKDVLDAIIYAQSFGLKVIAKNPDLLDEAEDFLKHPNVCGAIVERGAGDPWSMHKYRVKVGKPLLPVWFVSFGSGKAWAKTQADVIRYKELKNMGVTYSPNGEYTSVVDIIKPNEFN